MVFVFHGFFMGEAFYCILESLFVPSPLRSPNVVGVGEPVTVRLTPLWFLSPSPSSRPPRGLARPYTLVCGLIRHGGLFISLLTHLFNKTLVNIHHSYATHVPL